MIGFIRRHLDPSEVMAELLFGVIMTLTFTLGAGLVIKEEGPDATREMLVGVIGCNIAWGVIDGLLCVFGAMYTRGLSHRASTLIAKSGREAAAAKLDGYLTDAYGEALSPATRTLVREEFLQHMATSTSPPVKMSREDLRSAIACFLLVVGTAIPAVLPFLIFNNHLLALRVSNFLLVGLMFLIGWHWAANINANRWRIGLGMAAGGLVLVQVTILLGG